MRFLGPAAIYSGVQRRALRLIQDTGTYLHYRKSDYRKVDASDIEAIPASIYLLSNVNPYLKNTKVAEYLDSVRDSVSSRESVRSEHQSISDSLVLGKIGVYDSSFTLGDTPDWNVDITGGGVWPAIFFTRYRNLINGRRGNYGDYRFTWELNRQQHLLGLSLMYGAKTDKRYLQCIINHIVTWIEQNPPFWSLNWMSSMELGLRMVTWCLVLTSFDEEDIDKATKIQILTSIYQQMRFLNENLSVEFGDEGSETKLKNNHTILELCCLMIVATCLPPIAESIGLDSEKNRKLLDHLLVELERQTSKDGMQVEQASSYLRFVLEALLLTRMIVPGTNALDHYIAGYMQALNAFRFSEESIFVVGDEDNGHVLLPGYNARPDSIKEVLQMYGVLYGEAGPDNICLSQIASWASQESISSILNDSGHWLCRIVAPETNYAIYFRAGRLDFPTIPGYAPHAHCDLLSLNLVVNKELWFVDRGTYTYRNRVVQDELRRSDAHNTVIVDGFEQMRLLGAFHSDSHAPCQMLGAESHTVKGILTLTSGERTVSVSRAVSVDADTNKIVVLDTVDGLEGESVQWILNLHPAIVISERGLLSREGSDFCVQLLGWEEAEHHKVLYSPRYGVEEDAVQLRLTMSPSESAQMRKEWSIVVVSG